MQLLRYSTLCFHGDRWADVMTILIIGEQQQHICTSYRVVSNISRSDHTHLKPPTQTQLKSGIRTFTLRGSVRLERRCRPSETLSTFRDTVGLHGHCPPSEILSTFWDNMERRQSLEEQLRCPVCLDVFTEPLMLQCGHSYCKCCVRSMTLDVLGQLQCPVCRCAVDGDSPPPNVSLARIIEALQDVSVSGSAQLDVCPQHQNPLSLYCEDEQTVICGLCGSIGAHRGHKVTPVISVYSRMKEDISCLMTEFQHQRRKLEDQICKIAYNKSRITNESDVLKWVVRKEFGELRRCLELEEAGFMQQVEISAAVLIASLQNQADQLNHNLNRMQEAQNTLQDLSDEGHLSFIMKYGSIAPRFRESQELKQRDERIFSSLNFKPGFKHSNIKLAVWKRLHRKVLPAPELLKLDPQTAHPMLELHHGDTVVMCGSLLRRLPDNPERFLYSYCVLANPGFSSGKHYWEVEVGLKPKWRLGLIKGTTNRKAKLVKNPESGVWLIGLKDGVYEAFALPRVVLPVTPPPRRLGVFLDYECGALTFYNCDSPDELGFIYSFRLEVQGKVYPLLDFCWHERGDNKHPLILPQPHRDRLLSQALKQDPSHS